MLKLGLMGLGAIGVDVEKMVSEECQGDIEIPAILVKNPRADRSLNESIVTTNFDEFIKTKPDVILEVAGHQTIQKYAVEILRSGIDLLVTSVGAFTDDQLYDECIATALGNGAKLIIPSAGIGSLDTLSAAAVGGLTSVHMIVRKDPSAWYGTHAEKRHRMLSKSHSPHVLSPPWIPRNPQPKHPHQPSQTSGTRPRPYFQDSQLDQLYRYAIARDSPGKS